MAVTAKQAEVVHEGKTLGRHGTFDAVEIVECGCVSEGSPHTGQRGRIQSYYNRKTGNYDRFVAWDMDISENRAPKKGEGACANVNKFKMVQTVAKNFTSAKLGDIVFVRLCNDTYWQFKAVVTDVQTFRESNDFCVKVTPIEKDVKGRYIAGDYCYAYEWEVVDERPYIEAKERAEADALKAREREVTARKHEKKAMEIAAEATRLKAIAERERDAMAALVARLREEPEHLIQFHADRVERITQFQGDPVGVYEAAVLRLTPWEAK